MQSVFLVLREPGIQWKRGEEMTAQDGWTEHARFIDALFNQGFLLFGGPLPEVPGRVVLVVAAASRSAVNELFEQDPWVRDDVQRISSVHTWEWRLDTFQHAASDGSAQRHLASV